VDDPPSSRTGREQCPHRSTCSAHRSKSRPRRGAPDWVTFHDLRHYYASLLIRHGESVKVVQKRLGHATATETLDTYSHLWPDSEDRTREAVDTVLGASKEAAGEGTSEGTS
jgi:integrase